MRSWSSARIRLRLRAPRPVHPTGRGRGSDSVHSAAPQAPITPVLAASAILTAAVFLAACGVTPGAAPASDPVPVIDAHIHTEFTGRTEPASGITESLDELLRGMEAGGVVGAVAHTDTLGGGLAAVPGRAVIHCGGVGGEPDLTALEAGLRERRYRCLKVYTGYAWRYASDSSYDGVYALAARYDVPVVFHTGDTYSTRGKLKYADPLTVDEVAVDHPDVTFVIAHAGYPWFQAAAEVAYKNPNVFIEASAFMVGDPAKAAPDWLERYVVEPIAWIFGYLEDPSKLMFGSDWPLVDIPGYVAAYQRAIPREHWRAVFHDNAVRVFRLSDDTALQVRPESGGGRR